MDLQITYQAPQIDIVTLNTEIGYAASLFISIQPEEVFIDESHEKQGNETSTYEHISWEW